MEAVFSLVTSLFCALTQFTFSSLFKRTKKMKKNLRSLSLQCIFFQRIFSTVFSPFFSCNFRTNQHRLCLSPTKLLADGNINTVIGFISQAFIFFCFELTLCLKFESNEYNEAFCQVFTRDSLWFSLNWT